MKSIIKYLLLFMASIALMTVALVGVATIPRDHIQKKSEESAEQLIKRDTAYYNLIGGTAGRAVLSPWDCSKIDQTADSYLLSIAYYLDEDHPLESVLWARYYEGREDEAAPLKNMNESFYRSVYENVPTNKQYLRYWHGSLVFVRPLLMVMNLNQMKFFFGVVIAVLLTSLLILLIRKMLVAEATCLGISMIAISIWFVPVSLEYVWMFILMLVTSIVTVMLGVREKEKCIPMLLFLTGMCAAYFDFFTTETITLLIPLLLCIRVMYRNAYDEKKIWQLSIKSTLLWGIGYVGCWMAKWGIAAAVFRTNTIPYVQNRVLVHLGAYDEHGVALGVIGAVLRNLAQLSPFGYGVIAAPATLGLIVIFVFLPVYCGKIRLRTEISWSRISLYGLLGMFVFVRLIVLWQHSWRHYFFTYRALSASILALCFIVLELIEPTRRKAVTTDA